MKKMIKVAVVSDLHLEARIQSIDKVISPIIENSADSDVLVIAGDVCSGRYKDLLSDFYTVLCRRFPLVLHVPGNHEYWHSSFEEVDRNLLKISDEIDNFHVLDNSLTSYKGVTFYGGTLWFNNNEMVQLYKKNWPDFEYIDDSDVLFEKADKFRAYFPDKVDVVISHHMPTYDSVSARWAGSQVNCYFVNECEDLIPRAKVWVHGHTHDKKDYMFGDTNIICNPLGMPFEGSSRDYAPVYFEV